MVKGVCRQVIVVRQPEARMFEQAIFLLREDAQNKDVSDEQLLRQAHHAADQYLESLRTKAPRRHAWLTPLIWMASGAGVMGLAWLLSALL